MSVGVDEGRMWGDKRTRRTFFVTATIGAIVLIPFLWPQLVGMQRSVVIAQIVAFRMPLALGLLAVALVVALIAVICRRWRMFSAALAAFALVAGAGGAVNGAVLGFRGLGGGTAESDLVVASWNTLGVAVSPASIASLALEADADIVVLPEGRAATAQEVERLLADEGLAMRVFTAGGGKETTPISLLIAEDLGDYQWDATAGTTPILASGVWRPVAGDGPVIVAAHPAAPVPDWMEEWQDGLTWVTALCHEPDVIIAGDLNATLDHLSGLTAGCTDAAATAGAGAVGTWPTRVPAWLGAPIDHVLVGSAWEVQGAQVLTSFDDAGSDHRPVIAMLSRR